MCFFELAGLATIVEGEMNQVLSIARSCYVIRITLAMRAETAGVAMGLVGTAYPLIVVGVGKGSSCPPLLCLVLFFRATAGDPEVCAK